VSGASIAITVSVTISVRLTLTLCHRKILTLSP